MYPRLLNLSEQSHDSILLLGPRGTGKTYFLKTHFPDALYFDLLSYDTHLALSANPGTLENHIPSTYTGWVIIDEVQKIPHLLDEVHRLIEAKNIRFILTGSSARTLRRKGVNLLAGRALTYYMHPLTCEEVGQSFDLNHSLQCGMLPKTFQTRDPKHYLSSYIQTYLKEEVQQEALTRNMAMFSRFLITASFSQGEVLNYTEIAREVGTIRQTIANFFEILEDLLIAVRLPVFKRRAKRDMTVQPKFYYFDAGVYTTLRPKGPIDSDSELAGAALETLFFQEARALNDYYRWEYTFYYWRTKSQKEVDFILYGPHGLFAFEIKRKQKLQPKDTQAIKLFKQDYPEATCYLLYGGNHAYYDQDIHIVPFEDTIKTLTQLIGPNHKA